MKIGILTTDTQKKENISLVEAAKKMGHEAYLLDSLLCSISVCPDTPAVYYNGKSIGRKFDLIIPRIDTPNTEYALTVLRQFESMGIPTTEKASALELGRNKLRCAQHFLLEDIPFPPTGFAYSKDDYDVIVDKLGGTPVVIKQIDGKGGTGVFLAHDMKQATNLLRTFKQISAPLIMQKFIEESSGTDLRAYIVGDKVVAAMMRQSSDGDFRANSSVGGTNSQAMLSLEEQELAIKASRIIGINVAGVDLIRSNAGPLVLNVCTSADFAGAWNIEALSNIDIAKEIIEYATGQQQKPSQTKIPQQAA